MRVALFGGSFDPVHAEHVRLVKTAIDKLDLDKIWIVPSFVAPHKSGGASVNGKDRLMLLRTAFGGFERVGVSSYEIDRGGVSYTCLTCRAFAEKYPDAERFFLVGADMLEDFYSWKEPESILRFVKLVACGREGALPPDAHARFYRRFSTDFEELDFIGGKLSSSYLRVALAFGKEPEGLVGDTLEMIRQRGLYSYPGLTAALSLETAERREHSFRTALMACKRARSLKIPERKALIAAAIHDCGKSVPLSDELLKDFSPPEGVPKPVMHQFTGAYLAEKFFNVEDGEILDAVRYHTTAKAGMSELGKLIYLADLLEPSRNFPGVAELRDLFWRDLDGCLYRALKEQIEYLKSDGKPVYNLTEQAYQWISRAVGG